MNMTRTLFLRLGFVLTALVLVGAACQKTTTTTNTTTVTNTTSSTTNDSSGDSGSFNTGGSSATNQGNGQTVTVTVSSSGLDEKTVPITPGTTVIFQNTDSVSHQIASNPHPSHTDLPGFDRVIAAGAVYQFTFTKIGSWGYHDHLRASDGKFQGTVKVQ